MTAFEAIDKMLKRKRKMGAEYALETQLVVRSSTGPVRRHKLHLRR